MVDDINIGGLSITGTSKKYHSQKSLNHYLRYELNEDCLIELFKYLHLFDLMRICDLDTEDDQFFTTLIRERVIGKRLIKFWSRYEMLEWTLQKTFQKFGPFIKRLKIPMHSDCLNHIFRTIVQYSAHNALTELQYVRQPIEGYDEVKEPEDRSLFQQAIPYFSNIKNVMIDIDVFVAGAMLEFYGILLNLDQLRILKIQDQEICTFKWTDLVTVPNLNLTELVVYNHSVGEKELAKFVQKLPNLETFIWHCNYSCPDIGEALVKYCPKLQTYGDYCTYRNDDPHFYDFIGQFEHLTRAILSSRSTTAHDLESTLQILAQKNQLCELTIFHRTNKMIRSTDNGQYIAYTNEFSSLKSISFCFFETETLEKSKDLSQFEPLFRNLMTSMHGLQKVTLISRLYLFNLSKMLQFAPQIREINILQQKLHQMPAEVRRIRKCIEQIIKKRRNEGILDVVRIVMNKAQAREFKTIKNIDEFIKIVIVDDLELAALYNNIIN